MKYIGGIFIKKVIALTLTAVVMVIFGVACAKDSPKELKIFVASDIHYISDKLKDNGEVFTNIVENGDGRQLNYIGELTASFLADVIREKPDVLILSGDLTFNGERESHLELAEKLAKLKDKGVAVYLIPGNHDINNPYAKGYKGEESYPVDNISPEEFKEIYSSFGYSEPLYAHDSSLSYVVPVGDKFWFYMMDTNLYSEDSWSSAGMLGDSLRLWLDETMTKGKDNGKVPIVVTHHNLVEHSPKLSFGFTLYDSAKALEIYNKHEVALNLSGHIHVQHIGSAQGENGKIYDIASGSLAINPAQYGVITIDDNNLLEYSTAKVDVADWAKSVGINDINLRNYEEYTYSFFKESAAKKFYNRLEDTAISPQDKDMIAELVAEVNTHYFAGDIKDVREEILNSAEYKLWFGYGEEAPFKSYIDSMLDSDEDNTNLTIEFK